MPEGLERVVKSCIIEVISLLFLTSGEITNPKLSVIVVCLNNSSVLDRCLAALAPQTGSDEVEILSVGRWGDEQNSSALRARYRQVQWIAAPEDYTVPQMRARGIAQSRGDIIALLEDDCVATDGWCCDIISAHQAPVPAIGGPIEPGNNYKSLDWGIYFCEYGRFMLPFAGTVSALPGNNVSYKRSVLVDVEASAGFYEVFFHLQLQQLGKDLLADPRLVVFNINNWSLAHATTMPFHHGRAFAGMRAADFPLWRRGLYAALSLGLPLIKVARIARQVTSRKRYVQQFFFSIHWIFLFMLSWSIGEFLGYGLGAGDSASRWR